MNRSSREARPNGIPHKFSLGFDIPARTKAWRIFCLDVLMSNGRAHRVRVERLIIGGVTHMPKGTRKAPAQAELRPTWAEARQVTLQVSAYEAFPRANLPEAVPRRFDESTAADERSQMINK